MTPRKILDELNSLFERTQAQPKLLSDAVLSHRRVFVYAAGRSGLMLRGFAMRLCQLGMTVFAAGETVTPAIGPGNLLVTASASGTTPGVCRNAEIALKAGADLFVITAAPDSALGHIHAPDAVIPAPTKDSADAASGQVMGSLFEQALLIYCDAAAGILADSRAAAGDMRSRHANLE